MSQQNIDLVMEIFERIHDGDFSVADEHPGLAELRPTWERTASGGDTIAQDVHEVLAVGDWIAFRVTSVVRLNVDYGDMPAGSEVNFEVIGMWRVVDGVVVKQHSQGGIMS